MRNAILGNDRCDQFVKLTSRAKTWSDEEQRLKTPAWNTCYGINVLFSTWKVSHHTLTKPVDSWESAFTVDSILSFSLLCVRQTQRTRSFSPNAIHHTKKKKNTINKTLFYSMLLDYACTWKLVNSIKRFIPLRSASLRQSVVSCEVKKFLTNLLFKKTVSFSVNGQWEVSFWRLGRRFLFSGPVPLSAH